MFRLMKGCRRELLVPGLSQDMHRCQYPLLELFSLSSPRPCRLVTLLADGVFIVVIAPLLSFILVVPIPISAVLFLVPGPRCHCPSSHCWCHSHCCFPPTLSLWRPLTIFDVHPTSSCCSGGGLVGGCWRRSSSSAPCGSSSLLGQVVPVVPVVGSHPGVSSS